ncbi:MAG: PQQ-binding-like beta-propeller repeat protein [Saprospiraceae bacterium]|nr:PQQ-binding-like beta-propeller repeat protein [Saprospiraceae bacterium]
MKKYAGLLFLVIYLCSCGSDPLNYDWSIYKGGADANNYAPLDQINRNNVKDLQVAWEFYPGDEPENFRIWKYECNPITVDTVMYMVSAWRWLYAVNAVTGDKIWSFDPLQGERGGGVLRGVTYWQGHGKERIFVSAGNNIFSVDAKTGLPDDHFGTSGKVNLNIDEGGDRDTRVRVSTPGIIYKDLIIVGAAVSESTGAAPGHVRAYDTQTGSLMWTFHTIPWPGEEGYDSWPPEAFKYGGGTNNWAGMSLDEDRGLVFIPIGSPTYDYYGVDRIGANLFGNSVVALEASSGKLVWYYQTVHHDIWDYDLPTAPNLITIKKDGEKIDAIAQPSKQGFIYILDRETGNPIFPIEEKPVPKSRTPGEESWPTQPFPTLPRPFLRQSMSTNDLANFSPETYAANAEILKNLWHEGIYTPPDTAGTLLIPASRGGAEWGGGAYDPATGVLYINSNDSPEIGRMEKVKKNQEQKNETLFAAGERFYQTYCANCHGADRKGIEANPSLVDIDKRLKRSEILDKLKTGSAIMPSFASFISGKEDEIIAFLSNSGKDVRVASDLGKQDTSTTFLNVTAHGYFLDSLGRPAIRPPWGTLSAIDLNTGDFLWQLPLGNDIQLQKPGEPSTGTENYGGPIVTSGGLVFIASTLDRKFRAFDKNDGELLWEYELPGNGLATPSTYMLDGRQYISIAVSIGENLSHERCAIVTFSLPDN